MGRGVGKIHRIIKELQMIDTQDRELQKLTAITRCRLLAIWKFCPSWSKCAWL